MLAKPSAKRMTLDFSGRELLFMGLAVTILAYAPTLLYRFAFDDINQILANPRIQSWSYLPQYFTSHIWTHIFGNQPSGTILFRSYYRPLFLVWLRLNYFLFGPNPVGWHLTTVAAHIATASLVYLFSAKLLKDTRAAAIAALVFALLPVQIESVAWISGVSEPLMGLLLLGGYLAYLKSWEGGERANFWYGASIAVYALALLSKEGAAIFPVTIFAYAYLYGRKEEPDATPLRRLCFAVKQSIPYGPVLALYLLARAFVLTGLSNLSAPLVFSDVVYTYPSALWFYLKHLLLPINLALQYNNPNVHHPGLTSFWLPLAAILFAGAVTWRFSRSSRLIAFSSAFVAIHMLIPLIAFSFFGEFDRVHDRYLYVPAVGFAIIVAEAWRRAPAYGWKGLNLRNASVSLLLGLYVVGVVSQERQWFDDETLLLRAVQVSPDSVYAHSSLAEVFVRSREYGEAQKQIEIIKQLQQKTSSRSLIPSAHLHFATKNYALADQEMESCVRMPGDLMFLGEVRLDMHQPQRALDPFRRATELLPDNIDCRLWYAQALMSSDNPSEALVQYKIVLAAMPQEDGLRAHIAAIEKKMSR
jgi:tetratricopeptide (TPR) repeat protein